MTMPTDMGAVKTTRKELVETFSIDPTQLNESSDTWAKQLPDGRWKVRCVGQHCDIVNRNRRRYPAEKTWARHTCEGADFAKRVRARRVIGHVEHPPDGRTAMGAAAIVITKVEPPRKDGRVFIEFETMRTPGGEIIEGFLLSNVGFGISSRGNGSVIRTEDGVDEVQEDFEPVTFDAVADESTPGAEVAAQIIRESLDRLVEEAGSVEEAVKRDRVMAARALQEMASCVADGGDATSCALSACGCGGTCASCRSRGGLTEMQADVVAQAAAAAAAAAVQAVTDQQAATGSSGATPPANDGGEWLLGTVDGSGHYRCFEAGPANYAVYFFGANTKPTLVADGLRTKKDARDAAENHLHTIIGEANMPSTMREDAQVKGTIPFEGTCVYLRFDTPEEYKKAKAALEKAGFRCSPKDENTAEVTTEYSDAAAAIGHIRRVLQGAGIEVRGGTYDESVNEGGAPGAPMVPGTSYQDEEGDMPRDMDYAGGKDYGSEYSYGGDMSYLSYADEVCPGCGEAPCVCPEEDELAYTDRGSWPESKDADMMAPYMLGDPDTMPDDLEAAHDISDEYEGADPEDLDLDLDVNERRRRMRMREGNGAGAQRKNTGVRTGGSAEEEMSGGGGEYRDDQRKPTEGGSELPTRGRGRSEPQSAAKMAEMVIRRALPDLREAWRRGDGRMAAKIASFIERVTRAAITEMSAAGRVGRTRFLQDEVARLEAENERLRALTEAMAEVQREEVLAYERKLMLKEHPVLSPMAHRLERCDTVQEMRDEAQALLSYMERAGKMANMGEGTSNGAGERLGGAAGTGGEDTTITEGAEGASGERQVPKFRLEGANGAGPAVSSAGVTGAPTTPLSEATVATGMGWVTTRDGGDTASRIAASRRRRRRGGR